MSYTIISAPRPVIQYYQIRSRSILNYALPAEPPKYDRRKNMHGQTYSGQVTDHAAKRIRMCCEVLLMRSPEKVVWNPVRLGYSKFRITFATLTISSKQIIPHREAYEKGLKPLLRRLRTKWGWLDYLWKAELQKRGQIHYHITGNQFLDYRILKSEWNNLQYQNGWLDDFHAEHGHWSPNSTDIHAVGKVDRLDLYLAKYVAKSGGQIQGKVWDCSQSLKGKKYFTIEETEQLYYHLATDAYNGKIQVKKLDHCTILETRHPTDYIPQNLKLDYQAWLK